jgi:hypothetical protein
MDRQIDVRDETQTPGGTAAKTASPNPKVWEEIRTMSGAKVGRHIVRLGVTQVPLGRTTRRTVAAEVPTGTAPDTTKGSAKRRRRGKENPKGVATPSLKVVDRHPDNMSSDSRRGGGMETNPIRIGI